MHINGRKQSTAFGDTVNSKLAEHAWENILIFKSNEARTLHHESHYNTRKSKGVLIKLIDSTISQSSMEEDHLGCII